MKIKTNSGDFSFNVWVNDESAPIGKASGKMYLKILDSSKIDFELVSRVNREVLCVIKIGGLGLVDAVNLGNNNSGFVIPAQGTVSLLHWVAVSKGKTKCFPIFFAQKPGVPNADDYDPKMEIVLQLFDRAAPKKDYELAECAAVGFGPPSKSMSAKSTGEKLTLTQFFRRPRPFFHVSFRTLPIS